MVDPPVPAGDDAGATRLALATPDGAPFMLDVLELRLAEATATGADFVVSGADPQLVLSPATGESALLAPGDHGLVIDISSDGSGIAPYELYFDMGDDFSAADGLNHIFSDPGNQTITLSLNVVDPLIRIRIDPPADATRLTLAAVRWRKQEDESAPAKPLRTLLRRIGAGRPPHPALDEIATYAAAAGGAPAPAAGWLRRLVQPPARFPIKRRWPLRNAWLARQTARSITLPPAPALAQRARVAVHAHLHYPELAPDLAALAARHRGSATDFHFSVTQAEAGTALAAALAALDLPTDRIARVENRGRDIAPLFRDYARLFGAYDFICHVHGKRSGHAAFGDAWRRYLLDACLGTPETVAAVLAQFVRDRRCAVLYPENFPAVRFDTFSDANKIGVNRLLRRLDSHWGYARTDFPAGSMAWLRTAAWTPVLARLRGALDMLEDEAGQRDQTAAHALERCLTLIPFWLGHDCRAYRLTPPEG